MRKIRCQNCKGTKVIAKVGGLHEKSCPACEGKGHMFLVASELFEETKEIEKPTYDKKKSKRENDKEVA